MLIDAHGNKRLELRDQPESCVLLPRQGLLERRERDNGDGLPTPVKRNWAAGTQVIKCMKKREMELLVEGGWRPAPERDGTIAAIASHRSGFVRAISRSLVRTSGEGGSDYLQAAQLAIRQAGTRRPDDILLTTKVPTWACLHTWNATRLMNGDHRLITGS